MLAFRSAGFFYVDQHSSYDVERTSGPPIFVVHVAQILNFLCCVFFLGGGGCLFILFFVVFFCLLAFFAVCLVCPEVPKVSGLTILDFPFGFL
jgi:hypothetical protein